MDLIIKPTSLCQFKCTFCSSPQLSESMADTLDLDYVARFLDRFPNTETIIINGGDPLMVKPEYYWRLLELLAEREMDRTNLSFTSNLWDFYKRPDKWTELFKQPNVNVGTSFHYGESRLIASTRVFREEDFVEISDLFLERIGYRPDFIAVVDEHNQDRAIDNVRLAKRLDVECKLNYANASGRQQRSFLISDMHRIYLEIFDLGLMPWEYNTKQMINKVNGFHTTCPLHRSCDSGIRNLHPNGDYFSCGAFGDDQLFPIDFEKEMASESIATPLSSSLLYQSMHEGCYGCEMFGICNGCRKTVMDTQKSGRVEEHCNKMKSILGRIVEASKSTDRPVTVGSWWDK